MIKIFTPSFADEADTNAQNLSVKEIVARLDPARFAVTMLMDQQPDPRIESRPNTRLYRWYKHGNTAFTLARLLADLPDVYFYPREGPLDASFLKLRRRLRLRTSLVMHVVSGGLYHDDYPPARVKNIREADAVLANNSYLAELLQQRLGVTAGVIHNGIDRRYFYPPAEPRPIGNAPKVLYAGSMRPYKRVPMVVREAARHPGVQFCIAGAGEDEQVCRSLVSELKCANVKFLGHLGLAALGDEMRAADVFFFPSEIEGHPQVLGQAAACGLPCVACGIYRPDYVVDQVTGFLAADDQALAEKLDVLISNPDLRQTMGQAALRHVQNFDWDRIVPCWEEVFERVTSRGHR